jgi:hypothetical protein
MDAIQSIPVTSSGRRTQHPKGARLFYFPQAVISKRPPPAGYRFGSQRDGGLKGLVGAEPLFVEHAFEQG